jgi:phosphomannomutase/phosphoglucomutase
MNPQVFREYDIRGVVADDFDDEFVVDLGRAYATILIEAGKRTVTLGRDCRLSSDALRDRLIEGLLPSGIDVVDVGVVPTPLLYFSVLHWKMDGGAMITGSHNAAAYNGFKLGVGPTTIFGEEIQRVRKIIETRAFKTMGKKGALSERPVLPDYREYIKRHIKLAAGMKVAVDGGNGCGGVVAAPLMREFGLDTVELYIEMDGRFPNHHPDPTVEENMRDLQAAVKRSGARIGIAYDGDADRVGVVDERGRRHEADLILVLLARDLLSRHPGAQIVFDVKSSQSLVDDIRAHGGVPVMWKTGHSHLKRKMREDRILLGGEVSGHMFFAEDYYGVDDGILASCKVIELAARAQGPLSRLFDTVPHLAATPELKAMCPDGEKFRVIAELTQELKRRYDVIDIDGARVLFPGGGWGLVRASNTNPYLTLRFEAATPARIAEMKRVIYGDLARYPFVTLPAE